MLRVTKLTDYATVVLTVLAARPGQVLSASDLAEHSGLETPTVSTLLTVGDSRPECSARSDALRTSPGRAASTVRTTVA